MKELVTPFDWKVERMRSQIRLKDIANYMECSIALLSRYENEKIKIPTDKVSDYKFFIKNYGKQMEEQ